MWHFERKERRGKVCELCHSVQHIRVTHSVVLAHTQISEVGDCAKSVLLSCTVLPSMWKPVYWNWLTLLLFVHFTYSCYSDWNASVTLHLEVTWRVGSSRVSKTRDINQFKNLNTNHEKSFAHIKPTPARRAHSLRSTAYMADIEMRKELWHARVKRRHHLAHQASASASASTTLSGSSGWLLADQYCTCCGLLAGRYAGRSL